MYSLRSLATEICLPLIFLVAIYFCLYHSQHACFSELDPPPRPVFFFCGRVASYVGFLVVFGPCFFVNSLCLLSSGPSDETFM
jgi:hypothetical protein